MVTNHHYFDTHREYPLGLYNTALDRIRESYVSNLPPKKVSPEVKNWVECSRDDTNCHNPIPAIKVDGKVFYNWWQSTVAFPEGCIPSSESSIQNLIEYKKLLSSYQDTPRQNGQQLFRLISFIMMHDFPVNSDPYFCSSEISKVLQGTDKCIVVNNHAYSDIINTKLKKIPNTTGIYFGKYSDGIATILSTPDCHIISAKTKIAPQIIDYRVNLQEIIPLKDWYNHLLREHDINHYMHFAAAKEYIEAIYGEKKNDCFVLECIAHEINKPNPEQQVVRNILNNNAGISYNSKECDFYASLPSVFFAKKFSSNFVYNRTDYGDVLLDKKSIIVVYRGNMHQPLIVNLNEPMQVYYPPDYKVNYRDNRTCYWNDDYYFSGKVNEVLHPF